MCNDPMESDYDVDVYVDFQIFCRPLKLPPCSGMGRVGNIFVSPAIRHLLCDHGRTASRFTTMNEDVEER